MSRAVRSMSALPVVAAIFALVAGRPAAGAVRHVRTDGSDARCDGLTNAADPGTGALPRPCAFETPQKGVDASAGGDTVLLHAGTYGSAGATVQGVTNVLGIELRSDLLSESTRLVVKSAGDGAVIFDGAGTLDSGVTIWGTCFVTVEGIVFQGFTAGKSEAFDYGAAGVNVGSPGPESPSLFLILRALTVRDATLENVSGPHAEIAIWCEACTNNTIDACRIESVEPVGIAVGSPTPTAVDQRGRISNSTIVHVRDDQPWAGVFAEHTNAWRIEGNFFDEAAVASPSTDEIRVVNSNNWTFGDNVFYRPARAALFLLDDDTDGANLESDLVLNNTIECAGGGGQGIRSQRCTACEVRNNIIVGCASAVRLVGSNQQTELGFNDLFFNVQSYDQTEFGSGFILVGGDIATNPLFRAELPRPDPFYRLQTGSPAIDAGEDASCFDAPADGKCDMGAFQTIPPGGNRPPERPSVLSVDAITGRSAVLHGSTFTDPDAADAHFASQWQVDLAAGDFSSPVIDSGRTTEDLRSFKARGLAASTTYSSRVRYQDAHGAWSPWSDPTIDAGDQFTTLVATAIPPKVVAASPAPRATGVLVSVAPTLTFNVPLDAASVGASTVKLTLAGTPVPQAPSSPALSVTALTVTLTPAALLEPDTKYAVLVVGGPQGLRSRDGSVPGKSFKARFTTEAALASSSPASGDTGVATDVAPQLVFKWAVDPATANATTVVLKDLTAGGTIPLASIATSGATVTLTHAAALTSNHKYLVLVGAGDSGLKFLDGRRLGKRVRITFRTG